MHQDRDPRESLLRSVHRLVARNNRELATLTQ